jgi:YVTN family beta-propeller protein
MMPLRNFFKNALDAWRVASPVFTFETTFSVALIHQPHTLAAMKSLVVLFACVAFCHGATASREMVGRRSGKIILPVNQTVTPLGTQVELPGLRPQGLALSPDGRILITSGKTSELVVIDPSTGAILQRVALPNEGQNEPLPEAPSANILHPDTKGELSYTGLIFSKDGSQIYLANVNGSIKVFTVANGKVAPSHSIALPNANAPRRKQEIPAGLALSPDGTKLYVCANLSNQLLEIDLTTRKVLRSFPVGVAPYEVILTAGKAYVSNWGGGRPRPGDLVGPAGRGTVVKIDPIRNIANEGSVSMIDLASGKPTSEILVHLHSSALALSPNGRWLVVANAASDNLSVIDTTTDQVVETIWTKANPADLFGASPNALAFSSNGKNLYVANGTQNAIAVIDFKPTQKKSTLEGLFPVGWFPGALVLDAARNRLCVANIKGHPAEKKKYSKGSPGAQGFNSHQYSGSISLVTIPKGSDLKKLTRQVYANYHREAIEETFQKPRPNQKPVPIPERIGEPSLINHVVYIIKENRTYDQVLGDVKEGNGDPSLCIFGEHITPNQHKLVREFTLLDNTYCAGILSSEGHQWSTTAFSTDYMEKSFAGFPRSYPDGMGEDDEDALAYSPAGFIWDNAMKHKVSIWNFGEFAAPMCRWTNPHGRGSPTWQNYWDEFQNPKGEVHIESRPSIETIRHFTPTNYVGWIMEVPDVWRARYITNQLAEWEKEGSMPQLVLICLPNDHTSGTKAGSPTPSACAADNDLAFGQIIEAFSHSSFWKEMAILGIEDDPQDGFDHVSGYRTTAYVASPYAKRKQVISSQYSTISILRTIEQILGLPPMNQFDASAVPMSDCFTDTPDFTPFQSVANNIPLDQMNEKPQAIRDPLLRKNAIISARLNLKKVDACPEDTLNRILWHAQKGSATSYPQWAITISAKDDDD